MKPEPKDKVEIDKTSFSPSDTAIVIVTYNRSHLLDRLLSSIQVMNPSPGHVVIIDNDSADDTHEIVAKHTSELAPTVIYQKLATNTGGSGGFHHGVKTAYELGASWIWMMDDDVEVIPDSLGKLGKWAARFQVIQGRRYDYDGSEFYWQYRISDRLAIPIPFAPSDFDITGYREMNSGCFEGMFIHREVVRRIGLPDPRFFIYWDDQLYGWLASKITTSVIVNEFVLRRTRDIRQLDLGIRHFNASSNGYRYYIMRNRAILKQYYRAHGVLFPAHFALGTVLTFAKEILRLVLVEKTIRGTSNLFRGLRDGRKIEIDRAWKPMAPLASTDNSNQLKNH
ncbi:glycosyltransferase [Arthrobacter sp. S41]|uniref:glycosyltransferase n=1 Tax=Micrococcaceae TaxID=1268 RepID=UPI00103553CB|nr:glycosyltransferase [Arthrobacter sp. S41]TAP27091.1 glycosyltransferase [Arthrobacter sp. S41]